MAQQAEHACRACRSRKKKCDKVLPSCGYCLHRSINCSYVWTNDGTPTVPQPCVTFSSVKESHDSLQQFMYSYISDIVNVTSVNLQDALDKYFCGPHKWLPIIHPDHLDAKIRQIPPAADLSVLILSIYLLAIPSSDYDQLSSNFQSQNLYMTVKRLFAHVQAASGVSLALVQASLLISAYELAVGRQDSASISIVACARMAQVLGLDDICAKSELDMSSPSDLERINAWWGVVILERYASIISSLDWRRINLLPRIILSVMPPKHYCPMAPFPQSSLPRPSDLAYQPQSTSHIPLAHTNSFDYQARAVELLERACIFVKNMSNRPDPLTQELKDIDGNLWQFFSVAIAKRRSHDGNFSCGHIATAIR